VLRGGAGQLIQSFGALLRVEPGFRSEGVAAMTVNVPFSRYAANQAWATRHEEILARLRSTPGIEAAAGIGYLPVRSIGEGRYVRIPGVYDPPAEDRAVLRVFPVTTGAFEMLGIPMVSGRDFRPSDGPDDVQVAIVSEAFVEDILGGRAAIGVHFESDDTDFEIVGVVGDVHHMGLALPAPPTFYTHTLQSPRSRLSYVVRAGADPSSAFALMRGSVEAVDPQLAVSEMLPLSSVLSEHRARPRVIAAVLGGLAALALLLATLGVYGVLAYVVRGRVGEMGLRAALGASSGRIVREVFVGGMRPAMIGLGLGLAASALLSRYLESLLYEVRPLDAVTFFGGAAVLLVAAAAACAVPARWAARVDPARTLRAE
jgi:predicted permease